MPCAGRVDECWRCQRADMALNAAPAGPIRTGMGPTLNELSPEALEHIERARARAHRRAERRELLTELAVSIVFALSAIALAVAWPEGRAGWGTGVLLVAIYGVLLRISFEIGEGSTSPVQLAFIPMLVLLPPGLIPLVVLAGQMPKTLLRVLRRQVPPQRLVLTVGDSAFSVVPALVMGLAGRTDERLDDRPGLPRRAAGVHGRRPGDHVGAPRRRRGHRPARRAERVRLAVPRRRRSGAASASWPRWRAPRSRCCCSRCCRSAGCWRCSPTSGAGGSRTRSSSSAPRRRAASGCRRSSATPRTAS